jgi:hypothetical protein
VERRGRLLAPSLVLKEITHVDRSRQRHRS